jgi:insertion element IS1 protein InsB
LEKLTGKLIREFDEMWSFIFSKMIKVYIWLVIDGTIREIIGGYLGDRSRQSTIKKLWASLPGVDRQWAVTYTDFWESDKIVIPSESTSSSGRERNWSN